MKTIEERAYDYTIEEAQVEGVDFGSVKDGYIKGATDQRKIDIEAACKLYREKCILAHEIIVSNLNLKAIRYIGINVEESVAAFKREMEVMV